MSSRMVGLRVAIAVFLFAVGCGRGASGDAAGCASAPSAKVLILKPASTFDAPALSTAADVTRRRVKSLGMSDTKVCVSNNTVVVSAKEPIGEAQRRVLQTRGELEFRPVFEIAESGSSAYRSTKPDCRDAPIFEGNPAKPITLCARERDRYGAELPRDRWPKIKLGPVALDGSRVKEAVAEFSSSPSSQSWDVSVALAKDGVDAFEQITASLACQVGVKRQLAIVLDGVIQSHPQMATDVVCKTGIHMGHAVITGSFSEAQAKELALILRSGSLPVAFEPQP